MRRDRDGLSADADADAGVAQARGWRWLVATVAVTRNEENTRARYIAGPPAALRGTRPSQAIILVKSSASDAKGAPAPVMWTDCRASVLSIPHVLLALCALLLLLWR